MIDYDLLLLMPDKVTIELPLDKDMYSKPIYSPPVEYQCRIEQTTRLVRDQDGHEKVSNATVYLSSAERIPVNARITYPDGANPTIISVVALQDEDGSYSTQLST